MRNTFAFSVALCVVLVASTALAVDAPLQFKKNDPNSDKFWPRGMSPLLALTVPPQGVKLPEGVGEAPLYFQVMLGGAQRVLMVDRKDAKDEFYNRGHFDANGNGDYGDDPVLEGAPQLSGDGGGVSFDAIEATYTEDGATLPYVFRAWVEVVDIARLKTNAREGVGGYIETLCWYGGEFEANGKSYTVMVGDADGNGRFGDALKRGDRPARDRDRVYPQGDTLVLTPAGQEPSYVDRRMFPNALLLDGQLYDVAVKLKEGKLTLTPSADPLVTLAFAAEPQRILLEPRGEGKSLLLLNPGREAKVPAGEYRAIEYTLHKKDGKGSVWMITGTATGATPFVATGSGAAMVFGEPFVPYAEVEENTMAPFERGESKDLMLALRIDGAGGEVVTNLRRISGEASDVPLSPNDENMPREPLFRIVKPDGEVVAQGNFEYG